MLDAGTADKQHFEIGDTVRASGNGPAKPYKLTGVAQFGSVSSIGGASIAVFDLPTAQALFEKQGQFDIDLGQGQGGRHARRAHEGDQAAAAADRRGQDRRRPGRADSKDTNESLKFITYFLLGFGGIALFVGAFVILNTLSITVAQRSREFATLRTLGASRRQVMRSVVLEGLGRGSARLGARALRSASASPRA